MSTKTSIEWTDVTWNPVRGCSLVSAGCQNCYAMKTAHRFSGNNKPYWGLTELGPQGPRWNGNITMVPKLLDEPLRWKEPQKIFVNSMSDLFHEDVPDDFIVAVFGVMLARPDHIFQILTKRPERMMRWTRWLDEFGGVGPYIRKHTERVRDFFKDGSRFEIYRGRKYRSNADAWAMVFNAAACVGRGPLDWVWLGVSIEDQATLWRLDELRRVPAAIRFVSFEPLLEDLGIVNLNGIHWAILGGESGPLARPCNLAWIRSLKDQCQAAGVPPFIKQVGSRPYVRVQHGQPPAEYVEWLHVKDKKGGDMDEWPDDLRVREYPR